MEYSAPNSHYYCNGTPNKEWRGGLYLGFGKGTSYFFGNNQESVANDMLEFMNYNGSVSCGGRIVPRYEN